MTFPFYFTLLIVRVERNEQSHLIFVFENRLQIKLKTLQEAMVEMISRAFPCEKNSSMKREKDNSIMIEGYEIERGESLPLEDNG